MGQIVVTESLTLDGVMQAPAGPGEDPGGGFGHGGWAAPYPDEIMGAEMAKGMARPWVRSTVLPGDDATGTGVIIATYEA